MATALITGATAGIGLEFARQLAAEQHDLVLVARTAAKLAEVAAEFRTEYGVQVETIAADLAKPDDLARVTARLKITEPTTPKDPQAFDRNPSEVQKPVSILVNNAGFGTGQPFIGGDIAKEIAVIDVLITAVMVLSKAAAEQMVPRGKGAIINIGSIAALTAGGTYAAAKAWVRTFTEGLAAELKGTGVTATVIAPGLTRSEFHQRAGIKADVFPAWSWLDAKQVVSEGLAAARRGAVHSTPSRRYKAAAAALRVAPRSIVGAIGKPPGL